MKASTSMTVTSVGAILVWLKAVAAAAASDPAKHIFDHSIPPP